MAENRDARGPIRVLLADDHAMFRQGVREILSTDGGIEVVGEAGGGGAADTHARRQRPDDGHAAKQLRIHGSDPTAIHVTRPDPVLFARFVHASEFRGR